jgi:Thiol-disulfide isomerase and thioredoxins
MPLRLGTEMPELTGATEWLGGAEVTRDQLRGAPTLVHFWAVSCYICKNNMPTLNAWKAKYGPLGLKMVPVHMPRQESDLDTEQVKAILAEFGIDDPCAVDNEHTIGGRFQTGGFWPHYFLFDAEGALRGRAAGDAGLARIEATLARLMEGDLATAS